MARRPRPALKGGRRLRASEFAAVAATVASLALNACSSASEPDSRAQRAGQSGAGGNRTSDGSAMGSGGELAGGGFTMGGSGGGAGSGGAGGSARGDGSVKSIGDACEASDGWTPAPLPISPQEAGSPPIANPVPPGYIDYPQLGPGIGYCLRPSLGYPYGYFTMNCHSDTDCPSPARCDDTLCRAPCTSDADCASPMTCSPAIYPGRVPYCIDSAALQRAHMQGHPTGGSPGREAGAVGGAGSGGSPGLDGGQG